MQPIKTETHQLVNQLDASDIFNAWKKTLQDLHRELTGRAGPKDWADRVMKALEQ